jgi:hypothetical protein
MEWVSFGLIALGAQRSEALGETMHRGHRKCQKKGARADGKRVHNTFTLTFNNNHPRPFFFCLSLFSSEPSCRSLVFSRRVLPQSLRLVSMPPVSRPCLAKSWTPSSNLQVLRLVNRNRGPIDTSFVVSHSAQILLSYVRNVPSCVKPI